MTVGQSSTTTYGGSIVDGPNGPATTIALALTGSGTLFLSGTNTYSGGTAVEGGTLVVTSPQGIEDGTNLFVGSARDRSSHPVIPAAPIPTSAATAVSPVPEPGTMVLLAAGAVVAAAVRRRKALSYEL